MRSLFTTLAAVGLLASQAIAAEPAKQTPAAGTNAAPVAAADPADRLVCRIDEETGSRVRKRKICKTARQWDQLSQATKAAWGKAMDRNAAGPGGQNLPTGP